MNNDNFSSFSEGELSEEDLEIIRAFDSLEQITIKEQSSLTPSTSVQEQTEPYGSHADEEIDEDAEMLMIFLEEAEEDISRMHQALEQIKQEADPEPARFHLFQRAGHKLRGTTGAVGYMTMSTLSQHIESLAEQVTNGHISGQQGHESIELTLRTLDDCLETLAQDGQEPAETDLLAGLEQFYMTLGIDLERPEQSRYQQPQPAQAEQQVPESTDSSGEQRALRLPQTPMENPGSAPCLRIENRRIENLLHHTEQLTEQHTPIEDAQRSLAQALHDLQMAQAHLQQIEEALSQSVFNADIEQVATDDTVPEARTSSSLIARILSSAEAPMKLHPPTKNRAQGEGQLQDGAWDPLDIEQYTEKDLLLQSLRETIVEVSRCTSRAMLAHTALQMAQQEYTEKVSLVHKDAHMLRLTPFSTLVPRIRQVIELSALAQQHEVIFTVKGEQVEVDQEILEILATPLLKMLRTCIAEPGILEATERQKHQIWLQVSKKESEVTIEIGFSMSVQGGAIETMHETMQRLHGTIQFPHTAEHGIRFILRFPGSQGPTHCLLVHSGKQQLLVAVNQIVRVGVLEYEQLGQTYQLQDLLQPRRAQQERREPQMFQPLLVIEHPLTHAPVGILVDEVESEVEITIKPLKSYLQRPGIIGSASDGHGSILLALNPCDLLACYLQQVAGSEQATLAHRTSQSGEWHGAPSTPPVAHKPHILLADDSAYLRQTIRKMLPEQRYEITETRDGREAMVQLLENTPDICLLDIEMPNLNGFDLLTLIQEYPQIRHVKTIMLTSRTSEKHRQRAMELGAHEYLTKPCSQEVLLSTIERLLQQQNASSGSQHTYALHS